ncbi:unnamed protein product [Closterium sp. Naga37s-1]|nr:unnamed protein product [Closterium sp. Naga37s-1]
MLEALNNNIRAHEDEAVVNSAKLPATHSPFFRPPYMVPIPPGAREDEAVFKFSQPPAAAHCPSNPVLALPSPHQAHVRMLAALDNNISAHEDKAVFKFSQLLVTRQLPVFSLHTPNVFPFHQAHVRMLAALNNNILAHEDEAVFKFSQLPVAGGSQIYLGLPCTVTHAVTHGSPLYGLSHSVRAQGDQEWQGTGVAGAVLSSQLPVAGGNDGAVRPRDPGAAGGSGGCVRLLFPPSRPMVLLGSLLTPPSQMMERPPSYPDDGAMMERSDLEILVLLTAGDSTAPPPPTPLAVLNSPCTFRAPTPLSPLPSSADDGAIRPRDLGAARGGRLFHLCHLASEVIVRGDFEILVLLEAVDCSTSATLQGKWFIELQTAGAVWISLFAASSTAATSTVPRIAPPPIAPPPIAPPPIAPPPVAPLPVAPPPVAPPPIAPPPIAPPPIGAPPIVPPSQHANAYPPAPSIFLPISQPLPPNPSPTITALPLTPPLPSPLLSTPLHRVPPTTPSTPLASDSADAQSRHSQAISTHPRPKVQIQQQQAQQQPQQQQQQQQQQPQQQPQQKRHQQYQLPLSSSPSDFPAATSLSTWIHEPVEGDEEEELRMMENENQQKVGAAGGEESPVVQQAEERALWGNYRAPFTPFHSPSRPFPIALSALGLPPASPLPPPRLPPPGAAGGGQSPLVAHHATIHLTDPSSHACPPTVASTCLHQVQQAEDRALWWRHATIELASRILHCTALYPSAPQSALPKSSSDDVMSDLLCSGVNDSGSGGGSGEEEPLVPEAEAVGFVEGQSRSSSTGGSIPCDTIEERSAAVSSVLLPIASIATAVSAAAALADSPEAQLLQAAREALNKALCFENE